MKLIEEVRLYRPFESKELAQWLRNDSLVNLTSYYSPVEDHLADLVKRALERWGLSTADDDEVFDLTLFLAQIAYLDTPSDWRFGNYYSAGRWWRVAERYRSWEGTPQAQILARVRQEGDSSPVLRSGLGGGTATGFAEKGEEARQIVMQSMKF